MGWIPVSARKQIQVEKTVGKKAGYSRRIKTGPLFKKFELYFMTDSTAAVWEYESNKTGRSGTDDSISIVPTRPKLS
jgi:hypothetical protein